MSLHTEKEERRARDSAQDFRNSGVLTLREKHSLDQNFAARKNGVSESVIDISQQVFSSDTVLPRYNPNEWYIEARNQEPPINIPIYNSGSFLKRLGENEWVMTQADASLPGDPTYGKDKPMAMRAWHAPRAGEKARAILETGRRADIIHSIEEEWTEQRALDSNFSFVQISAKRGTKKGEGTGNIANISTGLAWDRQTPVEDCAREISDTIIGDDAIRVWFGPYKFLAFKKGDFDPTKLTQKLVDAPRAPYEKYLSHINKAQSGIQDKRVTDILDPVNGTGREFTEDFNGEKKPIKQAYQADKRYSFVWKYQEQNGEHISLNTDGKSQTLRSLATDAYKQDIDMQNMLYVMNNYFKGEQDEDRAIVMVHYDETATCCGFSTNAQREGEKKWEEAANTAVQTMAASLNGERYKVLQYPNGERYELCVQCKKQKVICQCSAVEEFAQQAA